MKVFSFDAETDGLWGNPFAIAAIVYEDGEEVDRFLARLPDNVVGSEWTKLTVLKAISNIEPTHQSYEGMIRSFSAFYMRHKEGSYIIAHMGYIVEAHLLREMRRIGGIGDWDAPFPLHDVAGLLLAAGEDPTSVDSYAEKHNLQIKHFGTTHNPLYDCEVAAKVFMHLMERFSA